MAVAYIFVFTLLAHTSHCWMLRSTDVFVQLNETTNVSLCCRNDNQSIRTSWMKGVFSITISKDGSWLAEVRYKNNNASVRSDKRSEIFAMGHVDLVNNSYLSLTWNQVSKDTFGRYQCQISGYDGRATTVVNTNSVDISELQSVTAKPTKSSSQQWPGGKYALLRPSLGCPDSTWTEGFIKIHAESTYKRNYYSYFSKPSHLTMPVLTNVYDRSSHYERNFVYIRTCKHVSENDEGPEWPKGKYCFHRVGGLCPKGFSEGAINIDTENYLTETENVNPPDVTYTSNGDLQIYFCCRNDGPHNNFINLPVQETFYLYRLNGACQWVHNMYSEEEYLAIDTENTNNTDSYSNNIHPDSHVNDVSLDFCYYKKFSYVH